MIAWLKKQSVGRLTLVAVVVGLVALTLVAWLADPDNREYLRQVVAEHGTQAQGQLPAGPSGDKSGQPSEAEKISRLQRRVEEGEAELAEIKRRLDDPAGEFKRAEADFLAVDGRLAEKIRDLEKLKKDGKKAEAEALDQSLASLRRQRERARARFDLAIQERKTLQEKAALLPGKILKEKKALDRMTGATPVPPPPEPAQPARAAPPPAPSSSAPTPPATPPAVAGPPPAPTDQGKSATTEPAATKPPSPPVAAAEGKSRKEERKKKEAEEQARNLEDAARKVRERVDSITDYLDRLRRQIALEQQSLETAKKRVEQARKDRADLEAEHHSRKAAGAAEAELQELEDRARDADRREEDAEADIKRATDHLTELHETLTRLQARRIEVLQQADKEDREAEGARSRVAALENPFSPHNILQWFLDHGPRLLVILLGIVVLHRTVLLSGRRIVRLMTRGSRVHGRVGEEDRADTLVGVFRNTASLLILGGGTLMLLDEVGIPIVPLMGGAAVFGLAVAFGAQNLIKDYFSGFMVLMEDQYAVKDVVRIGNIEGQVERITLRITVVRDLSGVVHFVPHGTITTVSNMTHGWSRAAFDIGVAYKEDADRVMAVLIDLGRELRRDPAYASVILDDPEMLGVDSFGDSAVVIKFLIRTRPLKQWLVKREMLRRIKRRFDDLGIEIPFPHRTIYHRHEKGESGWEGQDDRGAA
jgi:moderate conductance mechanosensitive channel